MKETLIELLVTTASKDCTEPPCWRTNELLGAIEKLVLVKKNDPLAFAEIARAACCNRADISDPAIRALLDLAEINGLRRSSAVDVGTVNHKFCLAAQGIDLLVPGSRKDRCVSFLRYQARVFLARNGYYRQAADVESEEAVAQQAKDKKAEAISRFLAQVYNRWAALVDGTIDVFDSAILQHELDQLWEGVAGTDVEIQWGHGNGPIHILQALFLTNYRERRLWDTLMADVCEHADKLGGAFAPWIRVLKAHELYCFDKPYDAVGLADQIIAETASPDTTAAAWLIKARVFRSPERYEMIQPAPDAHHIAAVATRELAALTK